MNVSLSTSATIMLLSLAFLCFSLFVLLIHFYKEIWIVLHTASEIVFSTVTDFLRFFQWVGSEIISKITSLLKKRTTEIIFNPVEMELNSRNMFTASFWPEISPNLVNRKELWINWSRSGLASEISTRELLLVSFQ